MNISRIAIATAVALGLSTVASAAIITPTGVTGNAAATTTDLANSSIDALIDGSGLSAALLPDESNAMSVTHDGIVVPSNSTTHWITDAPNGLSYFPTSGENPELTFSFGSTETFGSMYLWHYTGQIFVAGGNTPSDITAEFFIGGSSQGSVDLPIPAIEPFPYRGDGTTAAVVGFGQEFMADTIVLTVNDVLGSGIDGSVTPDPSDDQLSGGDRVGAGEIAFSSIVRPIPEPTALVMVAAGVAGVLAQRRR